MAASGLYETLGIDKDASVREIKKAYYREARDAHPDMHPGDEKILARFQAVADAYQTLADPVRRQQYDLQGLAGLAFLKTNATRLFGPPPWRVLIGRTDHWLWDEGNEDKMVGLFASSIPNGIAGVTMKTIREAYIEALDTNVATLLERVSQEQAEDTVEALEEYGLAVKAEPLEGERTNEKESPLMYFRRIQRELGEASESLRLAALEIAPGGEDDGEEELNTWIDAVRSLRSELRAAALELDEFKEEQKQQQQQPKAAKKEAPKKEEREQTRAKDKEPKKEEKKEKKEKKEKNAKKDNKVTKEKNENKGKKEVLGVKDILMAKEVKKEKLES